MSDVEMSTDPNDLVRCDVCQQEIPRSDVITDKGTDYPEMMQEKVPDDRDHLVLCEDCNETLKSNI